MAFLKVRAMPLEGKDTHEPRHTQTHSYLETRTGGTGLGSALAAGTFATFTGLAAFACTFTCA